MKRTIAAALLALAVCLLAGCAAGRETPAAAGISEGAVGWQDYNGRRIGVLIGPLMEDAAAECFPDSEYLYFNSYPDCAAALLAGKIDAFLGDGPELMALHAEQPEIDYIHDPITQNNYSFAFRKNDPESAALLRELNDFLAVSWADGTMEELSEIWFGTDEVRKVVDMSDLTGPNGTVRVVTTSTDMPYSYIKDGRNVGYDIDLVVRFCRARGYALELGDVDFAGRIPAIQSGKYDFTTDMNVTPEREEQVLFSDPTSHGGIVLAVRAADLASADTDVGVYASVDDLAGKNIGVVTGTIHDSLLVHRLPIARTLAMDPDVILLDEPTSALDPGMVGEVQAVIRDLARSGRTMLIVTHEMNFARAISNRVFYMDQGGIYEDGPPGQVFDDPQKELTRQFIRQLKVLELRIDSREYDFILAGAQIDRYCLQNDIPARTKYRIRLTIEELLQQLLSPILGRTAVRVRVEYDPAEALATVEVLYGGERFDPARGANELSYRVLKQSVEELTYSFDPGREEPNAVRVLIREKPLYSGGSHE